MKEQLVQWLSNLDYGKFFALVTAFLSAYGALLAGLVIGIIKTRITNTKLDEKLAQLNIELTEKQIEQSERTKQDLIEALGKIQQDLVTQNVKAQEKRFEYIANLEEDAKTALEEVKSLTVDDVLDKIDGE